MKFEKTRKWVKRIFWSAVTLSALTAGLLGYTIYRNEIALERANAFILRGNFVLAEELIVFEENFFLSKAKNKFARLRDGRIKLAHCRVLYGLAQFETAADTCLAAGLEVKTVDEKFFAYYYIALAKLNRGLSVNAKAGAATDAIYYLKEALKVKEDGEAQALLLALLEEEAKFKEMIKGLKDKDPSQGKPRTPSLFLDDGGSGVGAKEKGY